MIDAVVRAAMVPEPMRFLPYSGASSTCWLTKIGQ